MIHETFSETFNYETTFDKLILNFDGACTPVNPNGNMGFGWALRLPKSDDYVSEGWGYELYTGEQPTSNNVAEWYSMYYGLKWLIDNNIQFNQLTVIGDSTFVINQASGQWRINQGKPYSKVANLFLNEIKPCLQGKKIYYNWERRHNNEYCDMLSNKFIDYVKNL